jgi:hypothetical protein
MNRRYDLTESTEDYHTLNGRSFPYTLRESMIVTEPDQDIKIRMFNSSGELLAIHTHGHKATITHYDGVEHNPSAQIMRDIYDLAPAQRNDLHISTKDDGLHSYGQGVWIFHDHREKGITTDGMNPGGNVSAIVYKKYLTPEGLPKTIGESIGPLFTKTFFERKYPVWQDIDEWNSLGEVDASDYVAPPPAVPIPVEEGPKPLGAMDNSALTQGQDSGFMNILFGILLGIAAYLLLINREKVMALFSSVKGGN